MLPLLTAAEMYSFIVFTEGKPSPATNRKGVIGDDEKAKVERATDLRVSRKPARVKKMKLMADAAVGEPRYVCFNLLLLLSV
jgi:hypothetical protein